MSLVISQTLPYNPAELQLLDTERWSRLFPLMRPSVGVVTSPSGHPIFIDKALTNSENVLVAAIGQGGNISSRILAGSHVAAFTTGSDSVSTADVVQVLKDSGFPTAIGLVVVKVAPKKHLTVLDNVLEVGVTGALQLDHVLSLLGTAKVDTRKSYQKTKELLERFMKSAVSTTSTFLEKKAGAGPSVNHATEVAEFNSAKKAIYRDLGYLLSLSSDLATDVYSVHISDINGLSKLENNILAHEISQYLSTRALPPYITHSTLQDINPQARGWAISFCAIPTTFLAPQPTPSNIPANSTSSAVTVKPKEGTSKIQFSDSQVRKIITAGCESVIKDEPTITEYDTIVGDGDCGYTLRDGAKQVLHFISTADLSTLPSTLSALVDDLEINMGGTSGALYCIFLSSLSQELWTAPTFSEALKGALEHLLKYTRARLGDRTCLDCLIPFVETLKSTGNQGKALSEAEKGVEGTKKLEAKLGRSSYLDEAATRGVPDPGAYGLLKLLEGMVGAN